MLYNQDRSVSMGMCGVCDRNGLILYRTKVSAIELRSGATLYVGSKVRDSAVVRSLLHLTTSSKPQGGH